MLTKFCLFLGSLRKLVNQGREDETSIDKTGFAIIGQGLGKTVMKEIDFEDEKKIKDLYYHETIAYSSFPSLPSSHFLPLSCLHDQELNSRPTPYFCQR